jgi:transcription antitermination factor NusG
LQLQSVPSLRQRWFAAYTAPRHEKRVSKRLEDRNVESFLPLFRSIRQWNNRTRVSLELPLFPCYVFVRIMPQDHGQVVSIPGIVSLVGSKQEPWPLSDSEVEALRSGLSQSNPEPHEYLVVGERLRIRSGPLANMEGVLLRRKNTLRVVLTVNEIGRSFSVEVNAQDVEPCERALALVS